MSLNDVIVSIAGDMLNGLIVGVFTVIGVGLTIKNENRKARKKEEKERIGNKPEFIVEKSDFSTDEVCDIVAFGSPLLLETKDNVIKFNYPEKIKNKDEYVHYDYVLKNIGKTATTEFDLITTNQQKTVLFNYDELESYIKNPMINYNCIYDKKIFPNQELKIRIYYHKDMQFSSFISSILSILYCDEYGYQWKQPFFEDKCKLYQPHQIISEEYRTYVNIETALECFREPWRW